MTSAEYKAARERLGTQAEVASLLGINRVTVAKREGGALVTREAELAILALRRPKKSRKQGNVQGQRAGADRESTSTKD